MTGRHEGKVALITGGSAGIGRGAAEVFAEEGAAVVIVGTTQANVDEVVGAIRAAGGKAAGVTGNVADPATTERAVALALSEFGRLDHLVTAAGIQTYGDVVETTLEDFKRVFDINVTGTFLAAHAAAPEIRKNKGTITLISSVQGKANQTHVVGYVATKGALNAMTRALAVDEAEHGVRVNAVLPGSVDTPMLRTSAKQWSDGTPEGVEATIAEWGRMHALGRVGTMRELGQVCSYLASDEASFIAAAEIVVDGGLLARVAASLPAK